MTSYEVLKNRLTNGRPFTVEAAVARITALADALEITQDQVNELTDLAQQYGSAAPQDTEARLQQLEAASLEHDAALIELAGQVAQLLTLGADWYLLVLDRDYGRGVLIFCGVQLLYFLRIRRGKGGGSLWGLRLGLVLLSLGALRLLGLFSPLNVLALFYFSNFAANVLQSRGLPGRGLYFDND